MITPLDIERDYGARGGHAMHAEVALDQWFEWRPLHGFGRYRMPLMGCTSRLGRASRRWRDRRAGTARGAGDLPIWQGRT